jgi:hypothetical protein
MPPWRNRYASLVRSPRHRAPRWRALAWLLVWLGWLCAFISATAGERRQFRLLAWPTRHRAVWWRALAWLLVEVIWARPVPALAVGSASGQRLRFRLSARLGRAEPPQPSA